MNNERSLHIICHDVPWPPDYGGVFDLYYKIKALYEEGVKIRLHCFSYGRPPQQALSEYCEEVFYYGRATGIKGFSFRIPYIINSRKNPRLLQNLLRDDAPVLMEGIHCTAFLRELLSRERKVFLRLHNVETEYYQHLFRSEKNLFRKLYFLTESRSLGNWERHLPPDLPVLAVAETDADYYRHQLGMKNVKFLPVFIPYTEITGSVGMGNFCLYHGNLSVPENAKAAAWLIKKVFSKTKVPLVIAGRHPPPGLDKLARRHPHTCLVADPSEAEMNDLIAKAHINVLPSFNNTGIKLKLVHALYQGRHCVVNQAAIDGSGLNDACHSGESDQAMASIISQLFYQPFEEEEILLRRKLLPAVFNSKKNARQLIQWIY